MKYSIRSVLVVALVALQLAAVATILLSSYFTSEKVLLGHARGLMTDVARQTIDHSINFLEPAQEAADLSQRLAQQDVVNSENAEDLEKYFFEQLRSSSQFAGIFYGTKSGGFVYIKRDESVERAAYRTKVISVEAGERRVELTWRDSAFNVVARKTDENDRYDPRARPWYQRASEQRGVTWTDPYIFFTSQNPGITVAAPVMAADAAIKGVVGVDIEIGEISQFLAGLKIGRSGSAFIMNRNGDILAHPDPTKIKTLKADGSDGLRFTRIDEIDDPLSRAAFGSLSVSAADLAVTEPLFTSFELEGEPYLAVFAHLPQGQWPWIVGIHVPENDFLGTLKQNRRQNIIIAIVIAALTALVGILLARSITRPIAELYRQADDVARGHWPRGEDIPSHFTELSRAGTAFRRMAGWLDGYKTSNDALTAELRAASRELENRVHERTAALNDANAQLRNEIEERKSAELQLAEEVTLHKSTAEDLREARDRANAANDAKSRFLSNMSHELRTPMNIILGFGQMLRRREFRDQPERADAYVEHILESGGQLLSLIDQVLDLARIEAGKMPQSIQPISSGQIVSVAVEQAKVLAKPKDIEVIDETDTSPTPDILADGPHLKQALLNLLSNAIKYNHAGGSVTLRTEARGPCLRICVQDTGVGIPSHLQGEIFEPFNRLGAEGSTIEGTGVGLTLSKEIVERMGGHLGFESSEDVGSTFWIELPVADAAARAKPDVAPTPARRDRTALHGEMRILYVADHDAGRRLIADALGAHGQMTVETARTAEESLAKARNSEPDLIILDITLPGMDGFSLLAELRAEAGCEETPIIALSADAMPDQVARGYAAGFSRYLTKPVDLEELQAIVLEVLEAA